MSRTWRGLGIGAAIAVATLGTASAGAQAPEQVARTFCGRPAPEAACKSFLTIDAGLLLGVSTTTERAIQTPSYDHEHFPAEVFLDLGVAINTGRRTALGGGVHMGSENFRNYLLFAPEVRVRRWVGPSSAALDVTAGPVWSANTRSDAYNGYVGIRGITGSVALTANEHFGVRARGYAMQGRREKTQAGALVGIQLGSVALPIAAASGLFIAFLASMAR